MATTAAIQSGIRTKIRNVAHRFRHGGSGHPGSGDGGPATDDQHSEEFPELYDFEEDRLLAKKSPAAAASTGPAADAQTQGVHEDHDQASLANQPTGSTSNRNKQADSGREALAMVGTPFSAPPKFRSSDMHTSKLSSFFKSANATLHPTTHHKDPAHPAEPSGEPRGRPSRANPAEAFGTLASIPAFESSPVQQDPRTVSKDAHEAAAGAAGDATQQGRPTTLANCNIPLRLDVHGERVEIDTQVQIYATNAQLCHPFVSPALAYLGGLCPLFVMCGDNEVLRDEIIYL